MFNPYLVKFINLTDVFQPPTRKAEVSLFKWHSFWKRPDSMWGLCFSSASERLCKWNWSSGQRLWWWSNASFSTKCCRAFPDCPATWLAFWFDEVPDPAGRVLQGDKLVWLIGISDCIRIEDVFRVQESSGTAQQEVSLKKFLVEEEEEEEEGDEDNHNNNYHNYYHNDKTLAFSHVL